MVGWSDEDLGNVAVLYILHVGSFVAFSIPMDQLMCKSPEASRQQRPCCPLVEKAQTKLGLENSSYHHSRYCASLKPNTTVI